MKMKLIPTVAVTTQILLGNLCFMPMAFAGETMPMDHDMEEMEEVMEMVMTPLNPMSSLHCDGCVAVIRSKHHESPMGGGMPCNDGHCLSEHSPSTATVTQSSQKDIFKITLRPAHFVIDVPEIFNVTLKPRDGLPIYIIQTRTIVLRE